VLWNSCVAPNGEVFRPCSARLCPHLVAAGTTPVTHLSHFIEIISGHKQQTGERRVSGSQEGELFECTQAEIPNCEVSV
jgi:hypothetical protein